VVHRPLPEDDPKQRRPDIGRSQELLDWRPAIQLREGLIKTIAYFDDLFGKPRRIQIEELVGSPM
jgi:UDP-glucuronate decarboxylase